MKTAVLLILSILFLSLLPVVNADEKRSLHIQAANQQGRDSKLLVKARLLEYKSLCSLKDAGTFPGLWKPKGTEINLDSLDMKRGCKNLEKKLGHPKAVIISVMNQGNSDMEVPIESLSKVSVSTRDGNPMVAVAWRSYTLDISSYAPVYLKPGNLPVFTTEIRGGGLIAILKSGDKVDLLFLFPLAGVGDIVRVGESISGKIE
ncbi:MAG: hypothetical protein L0229_02100 [Blastocatellia bacterium]|nr:hypothetical protein [Blastocatellia bacterium]